jgi:hypothetical protein
VLTSEISGGESAIKTALSLDSETAGVDFKSTFNPNDKREFLEIIKDILAMANSGGGTLLFGLSDGGVPTDADLKGLAALDPAKITDAIYKYTDCQFQAFQLRKLCKDGHEVWGIIVGSASVPIVFSQTGNYAESSGKQKNAFVGGTVYFRHGAKSETGNSEDLRQFIERRLGSVRSEWLDGIAKVVEAPSGSVIQVLPPNEIDSAPVRFTSDPAAPSLPVGSIDLGWPHRQKEVIAEVNKALAGAKAINAAHILNVRRAHRIEANGEYCYTQKHVSPKYSRAFVEWIVQQFRADASFFEKAKSIADQKRGTPSALATGST